MSLSCMPKYNLGAQRLYNADLYISLQKHAGINLYT